MHLINCEKRHLPEMVGAFIMEKNDDIDNFRIACPKGRHQSRDWRYLDYGNFQWNI